MRRRDDGTNVAVLGLKLEPERRAAAARLDHPGPPALRARRQVRRADARHGDRGLRGRGHAPARAPPGPRRWSSTSCSTPSTRHARGGAGQPARVRRRAGRPRAQPQRRHRRAAGRCCATSLPVARTLSDPDTGLERLVTELADAARIVAPAAAAQAQLFVDLDATFGALRSVARPFLQDAISGAPAALDAGIEELPRPASLPGRGGAPGARAAARRAGAARGRRRHRRRARRGNPGAAPDAAVQRPARLAARRGPGRRGGPARAGRHPAADGDRSPRCARRSTSRRPPRRRATTSRCCSATPPPSSARATTTGTWQRFIIIPTPLGPNNEGGPASAPADGPAEANHLHTNPYPNTAAPGPAGRVRGGQRALRFRADRALQPAGHPAGDHGGDGSVMRRPRDPVRHRARRRWPSCCRCSTSASPRTCRSAAASASTPCSSRRAPCAPDSPVRIAGVNVGEVVARGGGARRDGGARGDGARGPGAARARGRHGEDPPAHLPRGQLLRRPAPGLARRARARRRRRHPDLADRARRSSSTRC